MDVLVGVLRALTPVMFAGLAAAALSLWRRRRDRPAGWAALSFTLLAGVTVTGVVLPDTGGDAVEWAGRLRVAAFLLFPYCLHRFAAAFTPSSTTVDALVGASTFLLAAATLALPPLPEAGEPSPAWAAWYLATVLTVWSALSLLVAAKLWRSGHGQPRLARRRMRLLAVAAVALSVALLTAGSTRGASAEWPDLVVQALVLSSTALFWAGLTPPRFLQASWRRPDEADLNQAIQHLVAATDRDEVADVLLSPLARAVGARGAALVDVDRGVVGTYGDIRLTDGVEGPDDAPSSQRLDFPLRTGYLFLWVSAATPFFGDEELDRLGTLVTLLDIALERIRLAELHQQGQRALDRERELSRQLVLSTSDCLLAFDRELRYTLWNPAMERITGIPASEVLGQVATERFPSVLERGDDRLFRAALDGRTVVTPEQYYDVPETGVKGWFESSYAPLVDDSGAVVGGLSVYHDVTERKQAEQLRHDVLHDPLTGMPNRTLFLDRLRHALTRLERDPDPVAVMFLDVDRFKQINDTLGHDVGDRVLAALGTRLTEVLRPEDTVARFGGDEMAVLCEHVADADHAAAIAQRIVDALQEPLVLDDHQVVTTVSVGIAVTAEAGTEPELLLRDADADMYRAKARGPSAAAP